MHSHVLEESVGEEDITRGTVPRGANRSVEKRQKEAVGRTPQEEVAIYLL